MPHVVTDNCHLCRFTDCVTVCPVACFHADTERTYIDPEVCIDCGACIPACPVHAIYEIIDMPDDQRQWIDIDAERCRALPVISDKQEPLPGAEERKAALGYSA
jgi:ferredoxin